MPKRELENPLLSTRRVPLHAGFNPDGTKWEDTVSIMELWMEVQDFRLRISDRELRRDEQEWEQLSDAIDKLSPLIESVLSGKAVPSKTQDDAAKLVPDKDLRRKVVEWYRDILSRKPDQDDTTAEERKSLKEVLAAKRKSTKCSREILNALSRLSDAIGRNEPGAAEALLEAAKFSTGLVNTSARLHPEQFEDLARINNTWPVLASAEPGWEKIAAGRLAKLPLGEGLSGFKTRLRPVRGSDVELPARRWARAAVRTIDETRWRWRFFICMVKAMGGTDAWVEFAVKHNWDIVPPPAWAVEAMKLKPFSAETLKDWRDVIRQMIREQIPDFHLFPEWKTQRSSAEAAGRDTPGEISNAILDDICSALKQFLPKPGA